MKIVLALIALAACSSSKTERMTEIDRDALERLIHDHAHEIEVIHIEPIGDHQARYVVRMLDSNARSFACAEFPSTIPDELNAAEISYTVHPPADRDPSVHVLDVMTFRHELVESREDFTKITIHPRGDDTARYRIEFEHDQPKDVYAEYPGSIVDEIKRAALPYEITP